MSLNELVSLLAFEKTCTYLSKGLNCLLSSLHLAILVVGLSRGPPSYTFKFYNIILYTSTNNNTK